MKKGTPTDVASTSIDTSGDNWFNDWLYGNAEKNNKMQAHRYGDYKKFAEQGYATAGEMMSQNLKAFGSGIIDKANVGQFSSIYNRQGSMEEYLKSQRNT